MSNGVENENEAATVEHDEVDAVPVLPEEALTDEFTTVSSLEEVQNSLKKAVTDEICNKMLRLRNTQIIDFYKNL